MAQADEIFLRTQPSFSIWNCFLFRTNPKRKKSRNREFTPIEIHARVGSPNGAHMTAEAIRTELRAHRPFRVRTADGKLVSVPHADFATLSPSGRTLIIFKEDDSYEVLDVLLISAIEASGPQKEV